MKKYNNIEREEWIKTLQPKSDFQKWHKNKVYHPTEIKDYEFYSFKTDYTAIIKTSDIIGIQYAYAYNCPSKGKNKYNWSDLLSNLKRLDSVINNFKDLNSVTKHIHLNEDPKAVLKFGNSYFTISGQHRLCLAKYLEVENVEVLVLEYSIDETVYQREKKVEEIYPELIKLKLINNKYSLDPKIQNNHIYLKIHNESIYIHKKLLFELVLRFDDMRKKNLLTLYRCIKSKLKYPITKSTFNDVSELNILDYRIMQHIIKYNSSNTSNK